MLSLLYLLSLSGVAFSPNAQKNGCKASCDKEYMKHQKCADTFEAENMWLSGDFTEEQTGEGYKLKGIFIGKIP